MDDPHPFRKIGRGLVALLLTAVLASYGALWTLAIANEATNAKQSADIMAATDLHRSVEGRMQRLQDQLGEISQQLAGMAKDVEWLRAKQDK